MAKLIANRYGLAMFDAGKDLDKIDVFYEELNYLRDVFSLNPDLLKVLSHPKIKKAEKRRLIEDIFKDGISQEVKNLIYILIDKNREGNLLEIIDVYEDLYYEEEGIVRVVAVTAKAIDEDRRSRLIDVLAEKLDRKIQLENRVDEDVIGGVKLELEGKLIDATIQGKLDSMRKSFTAATN